MPILFPLRGTFDQRIWVLGLTELVPHGSRSNKGRIWVLGFFPRKSMRVNIGQRSKSFIGSKEKQILVHCFIFSNFEYCPVVWYFSFSRSLRNIEKFLERALRLLFNDHINSFKDLLSKSDRCTMLISRQRALCIEIMKTVNKVKPLFIQKIFKLRTSCYSLRDPKNLAHIRPNQTTFRSNSLTSIGPQIWNNPSNELKSAENLKSFRRQIKNWDVQYIARSFL